MRRLRLFRVLLLASMPLFVLVLVVMWRSPHVGLLQSPPANRASEEAEEIEFVDLLGGKRKFTLKADRVEGSGNGEYRFREVKPLRFYRDGQGALVMRADSAVVGGPEGGRLIRLDGGVELEDEDEHLVLSLPALEIDEAAEEARSLGAVEFRSPRYSGRAASVVYGLEGGSGLLEGVEVTTSEGSALRSPRARLLKGTREVLFEGGVEFSGPTSRFEAEGMRLYRRDGGELDRLEAEGRVRGRAARGGLPAIEVGADHAEVRWDEHGRPAAAVLDGHATARQGPREIAARRIEASRAGATEDWWFSARGEVVAAALLEGGRTTLTASELSGVVDSRGDLRRGEAHGAVRFESAEASAEAESASFEPGRPGGEVTLHASAARRARVVRAESRVAAERIVTNPSGSYLLAEVRVEASLLPAAPGQPRPQELGVFKRDEAVHFVADRLEGNPRTQELEFTGDVRGWQGERNLKARRVRLERSGERLVATEEVTTRIPRLPAGAVSQADFVEVLSERLDYLGSERRATFTGAVRVRQAEGWMESRELIAELSEEGEGLREMRATGAVRFEFRAPNPEGKPTPVTGSGDRVVYLPAERALTLYGDQSPAAVRRSGEGGGTTTGRVLRYHLDTGALEVESGGRDRAKVRTADE